MTIISREIFPLCGLSYADCISVAGMNQKDAAKKLGVDHAHFNQVIKRLGMCHWYPVTRPRKLSRRKVTRLGKQGYTQQDAAAIAGVGYSTFNEAVKFYKLRHLFPANGEAQAISRRGYAN